MGQYNALSPAVLGMEWRPTIQTDVTLAGTASGLAMRIMPGSTTIDTIYIYIKSIVGSPGIGVEVLSSLNPPAPISGAEVEERFVIGTDTGLVSTGWETDANSTTAANLRGAIDEYPPNTSDYIRNAAQLKPNAKLKFGGRGNATALTSKRIEGVEINGFVRTSRSENTTRDGPRIKGWLNIGGVDYFQDRGKRSHADSKWRSGEFGEWEKNPATGLPWTLAEVNALISTTASDEFGVQIDSATVAAEGFQISHLHLEVESTGITTGDVRKGFKYLAEPPVPGWNAFTLTSTSAESASTYYWLHVYPLSASGSFTIPMLRDPRSGFAVTTLATETGFHRQAYNTTLSAGGVINTYSALPGSMWPVMFSAGGTFNSQSQAYAELNNLTEDISSTANLTQQITTTGGTPPHYQAIRLPLGWISSTKPSQPLNIQIRHGAGAETGGGTLLANIFVKPEEISQQLLDRSITLGPGIDPPATTQLYALIDSQAAVGAGWKIGRLDTRSDHIASTTPTVANIEGQSQGGQTDSQTYGAAATDRYDIPILLVGDPGQVGGTPAPALPVLTTTVETGT